LAPLIAQLVELVAHMQETGKKQGAARIVSFKTSQHCRCGPLLLVTGPVLIALACVLCCVIAQLVRLVIGAGFTFFNTRACST
jgi:hypothetical protein